MRGLMTSVRRWYRGLSPLTAGIVVGLVAAWLLLLIVRLVSLEASESVWGWLALRPTEALRRPWTLLTLFLLHRDPFHVLFNALALASLAPWVERTLGRRRFVTLLLACALSGSALYLAIGWPLGWNAPAFGATGPVLGILTAFALLFPEAELRFWFVAPLKAKNLVYLIVGMEAILLLAGVSVDVPVHVGAMLAAWAILRKPWQATYRRRVARWIRRLRGVG